MALTAKKKKEKKNDSVSSFSNLGSPPSEGNPATAAVMEASEPHSSSSPTPSSIPPVPLVPKGEADLKVLRNIPSGSRSTSEVSDRRASTDAHTPITSSQTTISPGASVMGVEEEPPRGKEDSGGKVQKLILEEPLHQMLPPSKSLLVNCKASSSTLESEREPKIPRSFSFSTISHSNEANYKDPFPLEGDVKRTIGTSVVGSAAETVANTVMRWAVPSLPEPSATSSFMADTPGGLSPCGGLNHFRSPFVTPSELHPKHLTGLRGPQRSVLGNRSIDREDGMLGTGEYEEGNNEEEEENDEDDGRIERQKTEKLQRVTKDFNEAKQYVLDTMKEKPSHLIMNGTSDVGSGGPVSEEEEGRPKAEACTSGTRSVEGESPFAEDASFAMHHERPRSSTSPIMPQGVTEGPHILFPPILPTRERSEEGEKTGLTMTVPFHDIKGGNTVSLGGSFPPYSDGSEMARRVITPTPLKPSEFVSSSSVGVADGVGYSSPSMDRGRTLGTRLMETILTAAQVAQALETEEVEGEEAEDRREREPLHYPTSSFISSYPSNVVPLGDAISSGVGNGKVGGAANDMGGSRVTPRSRGNTISPQGMLHSNLSAAVSSASTVGTTGMPAAVGPGAVLTPMSDDLNDPIESASPFFHSENALESSHNRLREAILSLHRPAQTDEELLFLFRHSRLLHLLPRAAQEYAVHSSLRREFSRGETILENGAPILHVYVVVWGEVDAFDVVSHTSGATVTSHQVAPLHKWAPRSHLFAHRGSSAVQTNTGRVKEKSFPPIYTGSHGGFSTTDANSTYHGMDQYRALSSPVAMPPSAPFFSPIAKSLPLCGEEVCEVSGFRGASPACCNENPLPVQKGTETGTLTSPGRSVSTSPHSFRYQRKDLLSYPAGGFRGGVGVHQGTLGPGQLFGIEQAVFDGSSDYCFRASLNWKKTVVVLLPISIVRQFLLSHIRFAQGVGDAVTAAVDVFRPIRDFCRCVFSASTDDHNDYLPLWSIVENYTHLDNVIHTKMASTELDTGAWGYALNRLPGNVTKTFCFNLVHALPPFVASRMREAAQAADVRKQLTGAMEGRNSILFINTKERRRFTWNLGMEGKTLVLLRDGFTDLLDFLTMICVHIVESNKLRGRLQGMVHPPAIDVLDEYLRLCDSEERSGPTISQEEQVERIKQILQRMPLTKEEQAGLIKLWKSETALKMYEVMMHREEYNIRVDLSLSRKFQTNPFHEWALNLRACVMRKMGLQPLDILPDDLYVDVVSSNTHCIKNLLSRFNRKYRSEILAYAKKAEFARLGPWEEWHTEDDILYSSVVGFIQNERPDLKEEYSQSLEESGITVLNDTAMTGLQVDVIPAHALHLNNIDATIRNSIHQWFGRTVQLDQRKRRAMRRGEECASTDHAAEKCREESPFFQTFSSRGGKGESTASSPISPHPSAYTKVQTSSRVEVGSPSWAQVCQPVYDADGNPTAFVCSPTSRDLAGVNTEEDMPSTTSGRSPNGSACTTPLASPRPKGSPDEAYDDANAFNSNRPTKPGVFRLPRHFIINMDFAFGAQAEGICRAVFSAFGHRIRSVSIMGKAGGLVGKRGDIQLATHVLMSKSSFIIEDNQDELRNCRNDDLHQERLKELAGPRVNVFCGNVLTVTGTMLQNVKLLRYYQRVWGCVGMEMEGSYFARVMEDFHQQGIARRDIISRFAYYTSDLPLGMNNSEDGGAEDSGDSATLSAPMRPQEGVPPLYAIARAILERILLP